MEFIHVTPCGGKINHLNLMVVGIAARMTFLSIWPWVSHSLEELNGTNSRLFSFFLAIRCVRSQLCGTWSNLWAEGCCCCCCQAWSRSLHRSIFLSGRGLIFGVPPLFFSFSPGRGSGRRCMYAGTLSLVVNKPNTVSQRQTSQWQHIDSSDISSPCFILLHSLSTIAAACILPPAAPDCGLFTPSAAKGLWHLHPTQLYISRTVNNPAKMCTELKIGGYWWLFYGSLSLSCASHHSHCAPTQHNLLQSFLRFERHTANTHCLWSWHTDGNHL